jgi:hypothetical protein
MFKKDKFWNYTEILSPASTFKYEISLKIPYRSRSFDCRSKNNRNLHSSKIKKTNLYIQTALLGENIIVLK